MTRVLLLLASVLVLAFLATSRATEGLEMQGDSQQPQQGCGMNLAVQTATNAGNLAALQQQVSAAQALASKVQAANELLEATSESQSNKLTKLEQEMSQLQAAIQNGAAMQKEKIDHYSQKLDAAAGR